CAPLPYLMSDERHYRSARHALQHRIVVTAEPTTRAARADHDKVRRVRRSRAARRWRRTARAVGIQPPRVSLAHLLVPNGKLFLIMSRRFVRSVQHHERRMVAIRADDPCRLI